VTTEGSLFETVLAADSAGDGGEDSNEETTGEAGEASEETPAGVKIVTRPDRVSVLLDEEYVGLTPIILEPAAGHYEVTLSKIGYYPRQFELDYVTGTYQYYEVQLEEITGYILVEVDIPRAELRIDRKRHEVGVTEIGIGTHELSIRAFGYEEYVTRVTVAERRTTVVKLSMSPAEMRIGKLKSSRSVVNPNNPGRLGEVGIEFEVSTFGTGVASILDQFDNTVRTFELGPFDTWRQVIVWDATNAGGSGVTDGEYRVTVVVRDLKDNIVESVASAIVVSRGALISYRTGWSGVAGMLYVPTAEILPASSFQVTTLGAATFAESGSRVPIHFFVRLPVAEAWEVGVQSGVILVSSDLIPYTVGVSAKYDLFGSGDARLPIALSAYGVATYLSRTSVDTQTNYTGTRVGVTGTLRSGALRLNIAVGIAAGPFEITYDAVDPPAEFHVWSYGRGGVMLDFGSFSAGLSLALRSHSFARGLALQLPFGAGAEVHWLIPGTNVVLSGIAVSEFESRSDYYIAWGGGIGLIH